MGHAIVAERTAFAKFPAYSVQRWPLPTDQGFLKEFLSYLFLNYWQEISFGPHNEGAVYEFTCPCKPTLIGCYDGYLTIRFADSRLRLCVGEHQGPRHNPTPEDLKMRHRPGSAELFRRLDQDGAPEAWGFEMTNGWGEPMITVSFANPFSSPNGFFYPQPRWDKLEMWRDISQRFLDLAPDAFDESSTAFRRRERRLSDMDLETE